MYVQEHRTTIIVLVIVLLIAGIVTISVLKKATKTASAPTPAFESLAVTGNEPTYKSLSGTTINLSDYIGGITIVQSWASWCPMCKKQLQNLSELSNNFDSDEVKILAINRAEPESTARLYLRSLDLTNDVQLVLDPNDRYYKSINGYTMPETVIYDSAGNIIKHIHGEVTKDEISYIVNKALTNQK